MSNFSDLCARVLASRLTLVDVGAAGAPLDVGAVSALCDVHAIEPREDAPVTDEHRFAKLYRHNIGLAGVGGRHRLHITSEPTASSLRRPNIAVAKRYENNSTFDVVAESEIECMTLADFAVKNEIAHIDFIKLDTQGTELEILRGAQGFLDRVSIIRTEVEFVDLYEGQGLFDDIVSELSSRGFRFVDFGEGQRRGPQPGKRIWADATFVRREYWPVCALPFCCWQWASSARACGFCRISDWKSSSSKNCRLRRRRTGQPGCSVCARSIRRGAALESLR